MAAAKKRRLTAEDLYRFEIPFGCAMSPDGTHVVYGVRRVDRKSEKKYSNLWVAPTDGGTPRQFTYGEQRDTQPRWSPDGRQIAFLSTRRNEKQAQIYLIPWKGGEARPLTLMQGQFGILHWSPDGRKILFTFRKKDPEAIEREKDERKKKLGIVSRHITRIHYKLDGTGFLPKDRWHLWVLDVRTGRTRQLTQDSLFDENDPCWSPDGKQIAFLSNRSKDPDLDPDAVDLYLMPARGGSAKRIPAPVGEKSRLSFSPDGKWLAYLGKEGRGRWWRNINVWIVPATGRGRARNLTGAFDIRAVPHTLNDLSGTPEQTTPTWSNDGKRLYFQFSRHGNVELGAVRVDRKRPRLESVIQEPGVVGAFSFDRDQKRFVYFFGDMGDPGQLWVTKLGSEESVRLTDLNVDLLYGLELGEMEEVWMKGPGGGDLHGWILKPPGFRKDRKYPSILQIHGGPQTQYGNSFMHEFYFLAAQGYVVHFCNPRGSIGYGEKHTQAIWNNWGTADYEDVMAWSRYVSRKPYMDTRRMGVTGGSYGGYLTNWIIGHTNRFKAAVTQRCVSNFISMYGTSDFNWAFEQELGGKPPWDDFKNYWRMSPMKHIGRCKTPTLVIHSEMDQRCDIEQGEQVFVALKRLGVETEMVRFPEESHGLSRAGRTDRRIERLRHILRWFDKYLR